MSQLEEQECMDGVEFRWGKKRGVGQRKEVQYYESFTYDGIEYTLYDCVYMYKKGETEPYVGKLVRIWTTPDNLKKVKIHWFFRPTEISNWLGDGKVLETEVFFASGEGVGLENDNPLEAIAGKCNVVCISKDCRNPQPSEEELKRADYIFYRTFDVGQFTISDRMGNKVGGLEVKHVFNEGHDSIRATLSLDSDKDAEKSLAGSSAIVNVKDAPVESGQKTASGAFINVADMAEKSGRQPNVSLDEAKRNEARSLVPTTSGRKINTVQGKDSVGTEKGTKRAKGAVNLEDKPSKKVRWNDGYQEVDTTGSASLVSKGKMISTRSPHEHRKDSREETDEKLTMTNRAKPLKINAVQGKDFVETEKGTKRAKDFTVTNQAKPLKINTVQGKDSAETEKGTKRAEDFTMTNQAKPLKINTLQGKGPVESEKGTECAKDVVNLEEKPAKKVRTDDYQEVGAAGSASLMSKGKMISKTCSPHEHRNDSREETDEKLTMTSQAKRLKESVKSLPGKERREGDISSVSRRPTDESSKWIKLASCCLPSSSSSSSKYIAKAVCICWSSVP